MVPALIIAAFYIGLIVLLVWAVSVVVRLVNSLERIAAALEQRVPSQALQDTTHGNSGKTLICVRLRY